MQCGVVLTLSVRKVEGLARGCIEIPHNFVKKGLDVLSQKPQRFFLAFDLIGAPSMFLGTTVFHDCKTKFIYYSSFNSSSWLEHHQSPEFQK